jgi:hypothetical protein
MQHPPWHRVRRRQPGKRGHRERAWAGRQHQIAEPAAAQHARIGDQAHVAEDRLGRRDLRTGMRQRCAVGHVGREDPGASQRAPGGRREFRRGQVGRSAPPGEHVRDHHVEGTGLQPLEHGAGVPDPDPHPAQRQPPPHQIHQRGVDVDRQLLRARPGRGDVTGQGESPGPQVQHAQRLCRRRRGVDHVPQPPDVLELQVPGVVQVDMRLRDAVDQQHPCRPPVSIPQQLGAPLRGVHLAGRSLGPPPGRSGHSRQYERLPGRPEPRGGIGLD